MWVIGGAVVFPLQGFALSAAYSDCDSIGTILEGLVALLSVGRPVSGISLAEEVPGLLSTFHARATSRRLAGLCSVALLVGGSPGV